MAKASYFDERAKRCIRLAKQSSDPILSADLTKLAADYAARAAAIVSAKLKQGPEEEKTEKDQPDC